jgi:hypothetical protein
MKLQLPKCGLLLSLCLFSASALAANYYVTEAGGGNHDGASLASAWSVGDFNASPLPTGGDTVTFSGDFNSTIVPASNGSDNQAGRLTLDFRAATLNSAPTRLFISARSYLTVLGGMLGAAFDGLLISFDANPGGLSHDITLDGFSYTGLANGIATFLSLNHVYNLLVSNCSADNVSIFIFGDSTLNHDIDITGCFGQTSTDTTAQDDVIHLGDAANITIEKCKLVNRAPADLVLRHNDVIQTYMKTGENAGQPTNWVIRYNWIEMAQSSGTGDCSWLMMQDMNGQPALKVYANLFLGSGTAGDNGILLSRDPGGDYYLYNNTFIRHGNPNNPIRFLDNGTLYAENNLGFTDSPQNTAFATWTMQEGDTWDYNFFSSGIYLPPGYTGPHGSSNLDPGFTNAPGNDFSLQANSPLRGRGDANMAEEYKFGIVPGTTWPNPALIRRASFDPDVGAYASGYDD